MATILILDTAMESASICLSEDGKILGEAGNDSQKDHAAWIQPAIEKLMSSCGIGLQQLDAVAVSAGPGSYTGLRVGMATAKGLCYALGKPLICLDTLYLMAMTAKSRFGLNALYCPMIDARRMEVYTALYDQELAELMQPAALVLTPETFDSWMTKNDMCFFGSGAAKFKNLLKSDRVHFVDLVVKATDAAALAAKKFQMQSFSDLAYSEPMYVKAFYDPGKAKS